MLGGVALLIIGTGLPVWALLLGVASAFAVMGVASGSFDAAILAAVGPRLVSLLDNDLLQAMPLYVLVGVLLQRLPVADALFGSAARMLRGTGAGPSLAALAVGGLIAPMNGSVASSSALLSRLVAPRLAGLEPARGLALISASATVGVVVPPSLVLILLGDVMLRAHTEASNLAGHALGGQRVVNTQDILHAALLPALCVLALWSLVAWAQGRRRGKTASLPPMTPSGYLLAAVTAAAILGLLASVFTGRLFAVEAAALGGCVLLAAALASRAFDRAHWRTLLTETLALSGALFALLVGATTFSLVFRLFGTDRWLAQLALGSPWTPLATALVTLAGVAACAWVLDAFEMIFVIVPIVAPLLIVQLGDAQQVAVLLLLVLQLSFLLPPMGYAVLMARATSGLPRVRTGALLPALAPFVAAQLAVAAAVFALPASVHLLDARASAASTLPAPADEDIVRQLREMSAQPQVDQEPAPR